MWWDWPALRRLSLLVMLYRDWPSTGLWPRETSWTSTHATQRSEIKLSRKCIWLFMCSFQLNQNKIICFLDPFCRLQSSSAQNTTSPWACLAGVKAELVWECRWRPLFLLLVTYKTTLWSSTMRSRFRSTESPSIVHDINFNMNRKAFDALCNALKYCVPEGLW